MPEENQNQNQEVKVDYEAIARQEGWKSKEELGDAYDPAIGERLYRDLLPSAAAAALAARLPPGAAGGRVLDLGCGYGEFINQVRARRKIAMDLNPDAPSHLAPGVEFLHQDCSVRWAGDFRPVWRTASPADATNCMPISISACMWASPAGSATNVAAGT